MTATLETPRVRTTSGLAANVDQADLKAALAHVNALMPTRVSVPVLACVLLEQAKGRLRLIRNVYDHSASAEVLSPGGKPGVTAVAARDLARMVAAAGPGALRITASGSRVGVSGRTVDYSMPTLPVEEFPLPDDWSAATSLRLAADDLAALRRVTLAAGRDDSLPTLTGVHISAADGRVYAAATDRYRLAVQQMSVPAVAVGDVPWLIPASVVAALPRLFRRARHVDVDVDVQQPSAASLRRHEHARFSVGSTTVTTRLIQGDFPKYHTLLEAPRAGQVTATVTAGELTAAVRRVAVARTGFTPVKLTITADRIGLACGHDDSTQASASVPVQTSGTISTAFNPDYLADALGVFPPDQPVTLRLTEPMKPVLITSEHAPGYEHLLMPVRIGEEPS